jgi:hypothetical protein
MSERDRNPQSGSAGWSPTHPAVEIERVAPGVVRLRHPTHPFRRALDPAANIPAQARGVAHEYLQAALTSRVLGGGPELRTAMLNALAPSAARRGGAVQERLDWLDVAWGSGTDVEGRDPRLSYWVARHDEQGRVIDRTLVLCAGFGDSSWSRCGEQGLRVVMHVDALPGRAGRLNVRVTGLSLSLPGVTAAMIEPQAEARVRSQVQNAFSRVAAAAQFTQSALLGYSFSADGKSLRIFVNGSRDEGRGGEAEGRCARSYSLVAEVIPGGRDGFEIRTVALNERVTHATGGPGRVFGRDPASAGTAAGVLRRRPHARDDVLDRHRQPDQRLPATSNTAVPLQYSPQGTTLLVVWQSALDGGTPPAVQQVKPVHLPLRSNDLGAAHAYLRGADLFSRMSAFGLQPEDYFRFARLPLVMRHRAGIVPGARDGETVNAQVRLVGEGLKWEDPYDPDRRSEIQVRFAAADLLHRQVLADAKGRQRPQYLGLAADPRWAWHEFGHVLNAAATGELELRFAHSIGDALAAVVCDPESRLAHPVAGAPHHRWRGATFPWVAIHRRHDRKADHGWSWNSQRFRAESADPLTPGERYRAYFAEQLLSSAIFRLYRCIGGDSGDVAARCSAADYVVYLLMRATALLGSQLLVPARTADEFVAALVDADIGTAQWSVDTPWNEAPGAKKSSTRVGGCLHKVIRWAFEQQGLPASGGAEGVDVYIADRRKAPAGDGGYWPVPLDWDPLDAPWLAHDEAIKVAGNELLVRVGNCGRRPAAGVSVKLWCWPVGTKLGPTSTWPAMAASGAQPTTVGVGAAQTFRFSAQPPAGAAGDYYVVAAATCAADPATTDPAAALPCAGDVTPLVDLIANDNNLGLRVVRLG